MHILFLCDEYPPSPHGGIGTFVRTSAHQLVKHGHHVSVVGIYGDVNRDTEENDLGVNVYRLAVPAPHKLDIFRSRWRLAQHLRQIHQERSIDLIEGNELSFGLLPLRLPIPRIIRIQGGHTFFARMLGSRPKVFRSLIEHLSFSQANFLCAVSRFAAETTREVLHLGQREIRILPNPVDTTQFRHFPEIPEQPGLIVFTGGLREKKGIRQLLKAMPKIIAACPYAHLRVYGADTQESNGGGSFLATLQLDITTEIAERIEFRGAIPHHMVPKINAQASVLAYPSHMETQGIVVIEGMASQKLVVASRTGPGPEIIEDGISGLLCDPYDSNSIAEKVSVGLQDSAFRSQVGIRARARAHAEFSLDVLMGQNEDFYKECVS
jgi:glycosyltransferase involved in cell wall biosynthesis